MGAEWGGPEAGTGVLSGEAGDWVGWPGGGPGGPEAVSLAEDKVGQQNRLPSMHVSQRDLKNRI